MPIRRGGAPLHSSWYHDVNETVASSLKDHEDVEAGVTSRRGREEGGTSSNSCDASSSLAGPLESLVTRAGQRRVAEGHLRGGDRPRSLSPLNTTTHHALTMRDRISLSRVLSLSQTTGFFHYFKTIPLPTINRLGGREGADF
jgi:hypothetical protein